MTDTRRDDAVIALIAATKRHDVPADLATLLRDAATEIATLRANVTRRVRRPMPTSSDIVAHLHAASCPSGLAWTGDTPEADHGHPECWLHHAAAAEIMRLRATLLGYVGADAIGSNPVDNPVDNGDNYPHPVDNPVHNTPLPVNNLVHTVDNHAFAIHNPVNNPVETVDNQPHQPVETVDNPVETALTTVDNPVHNPVDTVDNPDPHRDFLAGWL